MNSTRVIVFLLSISALASALWACDWRVVRDPKELVSYLTADPTSLNPVLATDYIAYQVNADIYESLLDQDPDTLKFKPLLAKHYEISPDLLSYTFWLREGVLWHDGKPLTADDVIFTFEKIRDPAVDAAHFRSYFNDVLSIEKIGDDAVRFICKEKYFKLLEVIGTTKIIPRHLFPEGGDFNLNPLSHKPVGSGPYKFEEWKTGRLIRLSRFDGYWGKSPAIDGRLYKIIPSLTSAFALLKKGALDYSDLSIMQRTRLTSSAAFKDKFNKFRFFRPNVLFIAWNAKKPFFSDRRVRIAMTKLVDRNTILQKILFGEGEVVHGPFYRFGRAYDSSIEPYPYNPAGAAKLLDESGWIDHDGDGIRDKDGVPFRFQFLYASGDKFNRGLGIFLKKELSAVGIELEAREIEWTTMSGMILRREFDAVSFGKVIPFNPDPYQEWHSTQAEAGSNVVGFNNPEADRIIEEARREFDDERRIELYHRLQQILHYEEPCTFLFTMPTFVAVAKRFEDVKMHLAGPELIEWKVGPSPELIEW